MQKKYRLKNGRVFSYLHRKGESNANNMLVLVHAPSKYPLKAGFIVSKKVDNRAVIRNKVRRRLREAFRALIPYLKDSENYIVIAREACGKASFEEIANSLLHLIIKSNLLAARIDDDVAQRLKIKQNVLDKAKFD
ncbi:MAG: ribonuclease P protein component [Clostridia bacterium]|nr:ribonuclease P protein component [Clostridia bacterium]